MMVFRSALWALLLVTLAGCVSRTRCGGKTRFELRGGDGSLRLRVAEADRPGRLDLCDSTGQTAGALVREGEALYVLDRSQAEHLRSPRPDALELTNAAGPAVRLSRAADVVRVLHPDGIPFGSIQETRERTLVTDVSATPIALVKRRDADAVITSMEGEARAYLVPSPGLSAAAVFALPGLTLEEQLLLCAHLGRGRLQP